MIPMPPLNTLKVGQAITPKVEIKPQRVWKYAKECDPIGAGLLPGARLEIVQVHTGPGPMWVRVKIEGWHPPRFLKIAGDELPTAFGLI